MALVSGKVRSPPKLVQGKGPLDSALPNYSYLKPPFIWTIAVRIPVVVLLLVTLILVADWLDVLPHWVPF
jgi:hypothetical protein